MTADADPLRKDLERLRKLKGLCPLTPEEAEAEFAAAPEEPITPDEVEDLIRRVKSGELDAAEPFPDGQWLDEVEYEDVEEDVLQLNRNAGEEDEATDQLLEELRRKALDDDEQQRDRKGDGPATPLDGR